MSRCPIPPENRVRRALELSPRLYDAALDPTKWPGVLRALRLLFQAEAAQFNLARRSEPALLLSYDDGVTEEQKRAFLTYDDFAHADPRTPHVVGRNFRPHHCREFLEDTVWRSSETYKKLHEPWGLDYTLWYSVPSEDADLIAILAFTRHESVGPFTQDDLDHLSLYVPHLRRAIDVAVSLASARAGRTAFAKVFDRVEAAVLIVDRFAMPVHANPAARELLDEGRALSDAHGPLCATDGPSTERLRAVIQEAGVAGMTGQPFSPVDMTVNARDGGRPVYVSISSLADDARETAGLSPDIALVGVFITDPSRQFETDGERLQRLFGLTHTETQILEALARTGSARRTAEATGRGYETVRKHIKIIRDKMGATSQVDLVRMAAETRQR
ncbi:helix-turn-helix transcriptional regulator [uncultured Rhodospira sp.]|uniref:helix-turn-helix transcriptional regulator n=1 Tax=uncultured Rhodospira sp. TaxID=1936189 RepID=UPI0026347104|nr:helix-turn-helix transcriptional regulator [uncultured Rhodospira sp.]